MHSRHAVTAPTRGRRGWGRIVAVVALTLGALWILPGSAESQLGSRNQTLPQLVPRVFLDCQIQMGGCPQDHFRTEITYVNWVRDREDADIHVIVTGTPVGSGQRYTLDFIGLQNLHGRNDELTYVSHGADARQDVIDGVTHALGLGLLRYAVEFGQGQNFTLDYTGPVRVSGEVPEGVLTEGDPSLQDRWDFWTFRFGLTGNLNIRETRSERRLNPQFNGDRVTETWKVNLSVWSNFRREEIQLSDGRSIDNDTDSWRASALVVRSISDHISIGLDAGGSNSVQNNYRARASVQPAVEWNYFPYMQATRRQMIVHYAVGVEYSDYYEETIFGETSETLPQHRFAIVYNAREQWGNAGIGVDAAQYLHDTSLYSYGLRGDLSLRVVRGLELNISGSASRVADQIHVPAGSISDEDILLGRQALPTGYQYEASVGFNYRWGSSFANVVNSRFPRTVRN